MPTKKTALQYLTKQMQVVNSATQLLTTFFSEILYEDWTKAATIQTEITTTIQTAHNMQKTAWHDIPKEYISAINRTEIIHLLQMQTKIADKVTAITHLVTDRKLKMPAAIAAEYLALLNENIMTIQHTYFLMNHLDKLNNELKDRITKLDELENATDQLQITARQALFNVEKELPAVDVITLYKLLEWTGDLADYAHDIGGRITSLLAN